MNKFHNELLSIKEVAKHFGISRQTLHHWTKGGLIKAYKIGRKVLYKNEDIEASLTDINEYSRIQSNRRNND